MKLVLAAAALALVSTAALADQCQWIDAKVAARAKALLKRGAHVSIFCEPCGQKTAAVPMKIVDVSMKSPDPAQPQYREISINGHDIDLAYTFLRRGKTDTFDNVARLVRCPATDVSDKVTIGMGHADQKKGPKTRARQAQAPGK